MQALAQMGRSLPPFSKQSVRARRRRWWTRTRTPTSWRWPGVQDPHAEDARAADAIDERSPATRFAEDLVRAHGGYAAARAAFTRAMSETPVVEQAAMMLDWEGFWARPKQLAPPGRWRTWGF